MTTKKIRLQFMIVPSELRRHCMVPNKIRVKIIDPEAIFLTGILGESGRKMVKAGLLFYFERHLARRLIDKQIAQEV